jgi:ATP-citrate lyase beta-subunit
MPRKKLSEYRAKNLIYLKNNLRYEGIELHKSSTKSKLRKGLFVVKVDQAIKKRAKKGLIKLNRNEVQAMKDAKSFFRKGFDYCLIEPFMKHDGVEHYISLRTTRDGIVAAFNQSGGIEVESAKDSLQLFNVNTDKQIKKLADETGIDLEFVQNFIDLFKDCHFVTAEINPLVRVNGVLTPLDIAVEVDDASIGLQNKWSVDDLRFARVEKKTSYEERVEELNNSSQSSFRLEVLNKDGGIFMLLSGGGASIALADEVYNQGAGSQLANYGEYSGAPNREETMIYAEQIFKLLIDSKATKKVLVIAGGVANFTDVKKTFNGIIDAFKQHEKELQKTGLKVFVRRGGPNEKAGLANMRNYLNESGMLGAVFGSEADLTSVITEALKETK